MHRDLLEWPDLLTQLKHYPADCFCPMISVDTAKLPYPSQALDWADRHFVVLTPTSDGGFEIVDNFPLKHSCLTADELQTIYNGEVRSFQVLRKEPEASTYATIVDRTLAEWGQVARSHTEAAWEDYLQLIGQAFESLPDLQDLGHSMTYFRLARFQLLQWLNWVREKFGRQDLDPLMHSLTDEVATLEHLWNIIEVYRIRKRINPLSLREYQREIWDFERHFASHLPL